jgi:hypothetical protein
MNMGQLYYFQGDHAKEGVVLKTTVATNPHVDGTPVRIQLLPGLNKAAYRAGFTVGDALPHANLIGDDDGQRTTLYFLLARMSEADIEAKDAGKRKRAREAESAGLVADIAAAQVALAEARKRLNDLNGLGDA